MGFRVSRRGRAVRRRKEFRRAVEMRGTSTNDPSGLVWEDLTAEKIAAIPMVAAQAAARATQADGGS
ncbi:hypothetical protein GCM10010106_23810 [Thermopolyspora flexuosa]|nr:hypothetical protein GCM10010106_23810 [Thermopolyspora flexuosa]